MGINVLVENILESLVSQTKFEHELIYPGDINTFRLLSLNGFRTPVAFYIEINRLKHDILLSSLQIFNKLSKVEDKKRFIAKLEEEVTKLNKLVKYKTGNITSDVTEISSILIFNNPTIFFSSESKDIDESTINSYLDIILLDANEYAIIWKKGIEELLDSILHIKNEKNIKEINNSDRKKNFSEKPNIIHAFKWKLSSEDKNILKTKQDEKIEEELFALHKKLNENVLRCDFSTFKNAFLGKEIKKPLNIEWINPAKKNTKSPDYSSIFNFLHALKIENRIDLKFNLYENNIKKESSQCFNQVGNIFCRKNGESLFSAGKEPNVSIRNFKNSATKYNTKDKTFTNIIQSIIK